LKPLLAIAGILLFVSCNKQVNPDEPHEKNHFYEQAYEFLEKNESDSAFVYFEKARLLYLENKDSLGVASSLVNMAINQTDLGDYYGSQETSIQALNYLDTNDSSEFNVLSSIYGNLSNVAEYLKEPEKSNEYIELAIKYSLDSTSRNVFINNMATNYMHIKDYKKAIDIFQEIIPKTDSNSIDYARFITNYSRAKFLLDSSYNPIPEMLKALQIRDNRKDLWGLNSSYSNLANYYLDRNQDSALYYTQKQIEIANKIKNSDARLASMKRYLLLTMDEFDKSNFEKYQEIVDSVELARITAKNQFALVRYEVEKNKAHNLKLQNEIDKKQYRINLQLAIFCMVLIIIGLTSYYIWTLYKRRKVTLELAAENRIKENQLKTSRKVHDVVANGIYRVMAELENKDKIDREELLDRLEIMYDKSRDISYEVEDEAEQEVAFHLVVSDLLKSFSNEYRTVLIAGNDQAVWDLCSSNLKINIEEILQELMVNMQKHSRAGEVIIRFDYDGSNLLIFYKDNGIGMPEDKKFGNGLSNTENRINNLKGKITFEKQFENGLGINIEIPINK
jgi:signal transduction histidine kinase